VTYDRVLDDSFVLPKVNCTKCIFRPSEKGKYYSDLTHIIRTFLVHT